MDRANNSSKLWAGEAVMQNAATTDKSNFFIHFQFNGFKTFRKIEKIPPPIIFGKKIYIRS